MSNSAPEILDLLPHRPPFCFITGQLDLDDASFGRAEWRVDGSEPFLAGHFPGMPTVPGVLIGEALAQLAGLVVVKRVHQTADRMSNQLHGKLAHIDLRFDQSVEPPASIVLSVRLNRELGTLWQFAVTAKVGDAVAARGSLALSVPNRSSTG
ncbi:MAG: beta-hydroxyacyl-ACP dehydratase [Phycisphaerae bacterium]|nr:beta-hydroxyacyl-ACP dehydratase [Phycisphaerae bacterium]